MLSQESQLILFGTTFLIGCGSTIHDYERNFHENNKYLDKDTAFGFQFNLAKNCTTAFIFGSVGYVVWTLGTKILSKI